MSRDPLSDRMKAQYEPAVSYAVDQAGTRVWTGRANGYPVTLLTTDPDIKMYVRGIDTESVIGAELVDAEGKQWACSFGMRPGAPATPEESAPDADDLLREIRAAAEDGPSRLASLIQKLDEHLTAGGSLPDEWIHRDYDDWDE